MLIVCGGTEREPERGMRGFIGGTNAFVDTYLSIGTSFDILYIPRECAENVKHPRQRFGIIARLFTNGKKTRRVYRLLDGSCKSTSVIQKLTSSATSKMPKSF